MIASSQSCAIWPNYILRADAQRACGTPTSREVLEYQIDRHVHLLPIVCGEHLLLHILRFSEDKPFAEFFSSVYWRDALSMVCISVVGKTDSLTDVVMLLTATTYWTETNIADGLTALTICIEVPDPDPARELFAQSVVLF